MIDYILCVLSIYEYTLQVVLPKSTPCHKTHTQVQTSAHSDFSDDSL